MTKSHKYTLSVSNFGKKHNLAHFERGSDGSLYITPSLGNRSGLHLSLHSSGVAHIATRIPSASARFPGQAFVTDIMNRNRLLLNKSTTFRPKDTPVVMMIIKTDNLFNKLPYLTPRNMTIESNNVMSSSILVQTDSLHYALDYLVKQKNFIKNNDMVAIYNLRDRDVTFFMTPMNNDLDHLRAITINPYDINSLCQLPGMSYLIPPISELIGKISNNPMSYTVKKNDLGVIDVSNLRSWMTMSLRNPR